MDTTGSSCPHGLWAVKKQTASMSNGPRRQGKTGKGKKKGSRYWLAGDATSVPYQEGLLVSKTGGQSFTMRFEYQGAELIPPLSGTTLVGSSFALANVPNFTNWTINFDKFRLESVEIVFMPSRSQQNTGSVPTPMFYCAPDFDSDAAPSSVAALLRLPRSTTSPFTTGLRRKFKPRIAKTIYKSGVSSAYGEGDADQWIDCSNADTPHFGFSYGYDPQSASGQFGLKPTYVYTVTFAFPIA